MVAYGESPFHLTLALHYADKGWIMWKWDCVRPLRMPLYSTEAPLELESAMGASQ
jgi:hypothetical protein